MPKVRAALVTVNSLVALSKVCSSTSPSSSFALSFGTGNLFYVIKTFSTASERWEYPIENNSGQYKSRSTVSSTDVLPGTYYSPADLSGGFGGAQSGNLGPSNNFNGWGNSDGRNMDIGRFSWDGISNSKSGMIFVGHPHAPLENSMGSDNGFHNGSMQGLMDSKLDGLPRGGSTSSPMELLDDHCSNGRVSEAVAILQELEKNQMFLDMPRVFMLIEACGQGKKLEEAHILYDHLHRLPYKLQVKEYNKMLEMYGRCEAMKDAFSVFDGMKQRNMTSWDTMIIWLAKNGNGEDAIDLFTKFKLAGFKPDALMFNGVFSACGVLCDITEGLLHFESMKKDYNITPLIQNYQSVVEMFGSSGYLEEALEFIEKMPLEPTIDIWEAVWKFSRIHGHTILGDRCAELISLSDSSRLDEQSNSGLITAKALGLSENKAEKKPVDQTLLGMRSRVHEYRAGDTSHPDSHKIYALLRCLKSQMKECGYIPETRFVLHDIDPESKEEAIHAHSERLATANALLNSPARSPVRIMKNLRVCGDCHNALKIISKLVGRLFVMRDAKRFHHLKDGVCSCNDYW